MTNEEATNVLRIMASGIELKGYTEQRVSDFKKAYEMAIKILEESSQGESVIKCKDCKYQVKEWREDKQMEENGYWVYGCKHFGKITGHWVFDGNNNGFCSDAEQKDGAE